MPPCDFRPDDYFIISAGRRPPRRFQKTLRRRQRRDCDTAGHLRAASTASRYAGHFAAAKLTRQMLPCCRHTIIAGFAPPFTLLFRLHALGYCRNTISPPIAMLAGQMPRSALSCERPRPRSSLFSARKHTRRRAALPHHSAKPA